LTHDRIRAAKAWALALFLIVTGLLKVFWPAQEKMIGYPAWLQPVIGGSEVVAAVLLLTWASARTPVLVAGVLASVVAIVVHLQATSDGLSCGCLGAATPAGTVALWAPSLTGFLSSWLLADVLTGKRVPKVPPVVTTPRHRPTRSQRSSLPSSSFPRVRD